MSISLPQFPGFAPGQSYSRLQTPVRSPKWNFKKSASWNNDRQRSVNGRVNATKYYNNPIWAWEWVYGYVKDNPSDLNSFYSVPIGFTDFQILVGFYNAMQGVNQFAYQPPDSVVGPTAGSIGSVTIANNQVTFSSLPGGTAAAFLPYVGKSLLAYNFSGASFLNNQYLPILSVSTGANTVTCSFIHGSYGPTADSGTITVGQLLANPDANHNTELVHDLGGYPTSIPVPGSAPYATRAFESVQLIDTSTLVVKDGQGTSLSFTLNNPNTVSPYAGYVINFGTPPTHFPLTASFTYYYICRFSEDTQDYENFMAMLWMCSSVKFEQDRA